jgi:hypothetical protein
MNNLVCESAYIGCCFKGAFIYFVYEGITCALVWLLGACSAENVKLTILSVIPFNCKWHDMKPAKALQHSIRVKKTTRCFT